MASPCVEDGCGIHLAVVDDVLSGSAIISPSACNSVQCLPDGLFSVNDQSLVQAGTVPFAGVGWAADLGTLAVGVPVEVSAPPYAATGPMTVQTFTNESACLIENAASFVAGREVRYTGPDGAHFRVEALLDFNGGGFVDLFNIECDYRFTSTAPGGIIEDSRASGAGAGGFLIPAGGSFTYRYQILLTNLAVVPAGSLVASPGLTFAHIAVTN